MGLCKANKKLLPAFCNHHKYTIHPSIHSSISSRGTPVRSRVELRCIGMSHQPLKKTSDAFLYCPKEGMRMYRLGAFVCFLHSNFIGVLKNYIALVLLAVKLLAYPSIYPAGVKKGMFVFQGVVFHPKVCMFPLGFFRTSKTIVRLITPHVQVFISIAFPHFEGIF